jgi:glutathionylspermidine synthase
VRELKKIIIWEEQRTMKSYVDKLDRKIFPYIECEGYEDVYPTYNSCSFSEEFYQELSFASKELFEIFEKTFNIFRNCSCDFLKQMEMPKKLYDFMMVENNLNKPSFLSRFDFIVDEQYGLHVVELNADTPCALVEAYYANKVANDYLHKKDANAKYYNDLKTMFKQIFIMNRESLPDGSNICFSCFTDFIEDCGNAKFLYENAKQALKEMNYNYNVFFVDFKKLRIDEEGLILPNGEYARFLYRLHPVELLINEPNDLGVDLFNLVKNNKLIMMNPIESIVIQNKGFLALVWSLHKNSEFYNEYENSIIEKYIPPTYFSNELFDDNSYVKKPIWGREGHGIKLFNNGELIEEKELAKNEECYIIEMDSNTYVYQKFIQSIKCPAMVSHGKIDGFLTMSCFVLNGIPSAYFCRLSEDNIAGIEAYCIPLSVK